MRALRTLRFWLLFSVIVVLVACRQEEPTPDAATASPAEPVSFEAQVTEYNLGDTTILQDHFPEDSPFRNMPVRLEGVIGVPESDEQHPVVLIMHGSHQICPAENEWPCSAKDEQSNYEGFTYLVEALAEAGYIALSINVNAEHTFGFGESPPTIRTRQLIEMHLEELAAANAAESSNFGLDLSGRVDDSHMTWLGHSRGGEYANVILHDQAGAFGGGFEDIQGLIQVAPALVAANSLPTTKQAVATILPACDQDLLLLDGQRYYESARFSSERENMATSVYLEGAGHNGFNTILEPESADPSGNRPDCTADLLLDAETQQAFLAEYTIDFLRTLYGEPSQAQDAERRLGILAGETVPENIYDVPAFVSLLPDRNRRLTFFQPQSKEELSQNLVGGDVWLTDLSALFCPEGYYVPDAEPGKEPCKRVNFNQPGYPQQFVVSWESNEAELRTNLPEAYADISNFDALQLRATLDPLSDLNEEGEPQSFTIELLDDSGQSYRVVVPNLEFPEGVRQPNDFFEGDYFTGQVHMRTVRIPLEEFEGVDLANITEIALLFDQTERGTLFVADLELVRDDL